MIKPGDIYIHGSTFVGDVIGVEEMPYAGTVVTVRQPDAYFLYTLEAFEKAFKDFELYRKVG